MRLEQLAYFETLIQTGSYTKAAELLHISQPSLTASIKAMEKELNKTLLVRNTRSLALTEDGKQVLSFAKETVSAYQQLLNNLNPKENTIFGNISIIAGKFFCELILEPFLFSFRNRFPKLHIRLLEHQYHKSLETLPIANHTFAIFSILSADKTLPSEVNVLTSDESSIGNSYQYLPLFSDTFGFCVAKSSPLCNIPNLYPTSKELTKYRATTFPFDETALLDEIYLSSNNLQLHIDAILNENGYCSIPYNVYQQLFAKEDSLTYHAYGSNMSIKYYLVYPKNVVLNEAEQIFIQELQHYLEETGLK